MRCRNHKAWGFLQPAVPSNSLVLFSKVLNYRRMCGHWAQVITVMFTQGTGALCGSGGS